MDPSAIALHFGERSLTGPWGWPRATWPETGIRRPRRGPRRGHRQLRAPAEVAAYRQAPSPHRARAARQPPDGSKRNIAAHYDFGNDFYELWLDDTMTYSSAFLVEARPMTPEQLECAQRRKWDRMLDLIQPARGDHVLEVGCGWGGFAIHAASEAGCRSPGSRSPKSRPRATRVREAGLEGPVDIRLQDYRDVDGTFDGIASIEMFEAVGEKWWPVFFGRMKELLHPVAPQRCRPSPSMTTLRGLPHNPDFIQRYIFPGGMLPSPERFRSAARPAGLAVSEPHFFGHELRATLAAWAERFEAALPDVRELGFDERFIRMWRYYLAYCRAGFSAGTIDVMQVRLDG